MRTLWIDAGNGAAGDMLLAALIDAGADVPAIRAGLAALPVEEIELNISKVIRHGLRSTRVTVRAAPTETRRGLDDITSLLSTAHLRAPVRSLAISVFESLARAESLVHGLPVADVHFHEVGALDSIADVVGCALALDSLGLLGGVERVVSPVAIGAGVTRSAHGVLPVPVPAVLELLTAAHAPIRTHPAQAELCTPTGAALLCTLATTWGPVPACVPTAVGSGAGATDARDYPNIVRIVVGDAREAPRWRASEMHRIDATIDDLDPRLWPHILTELRTIGAADAWCTPTLTHKGRPGQTLSALIDADHLDAACQTIFELTTTLGLRVSVVQRIALHRDQITVPVAGAAVPVKRGYLGRRLVTVQAEYDDALAAARQSGRPLPDILFEAKAAASTDQPTTQC